MRRRVLAVLVAALALGAGACDGRATPAGSDRGPAGGARESAGAVGPAAHGSSGARATDPSENATASKSTLAAAAATLTTASARFDISTSGGVHLAGVMDLTNRQSEMTVRTASYGTMDVRLLQNDLYVRGLPGHGRMWVHYTTQAAANSQLSQYSMYADAVPYLQGVSTVQATGKGSYQGTVDPAKVAAQLEKGVKVNGPGGATVAFQATLDDRGRLLSLTVTVTADGKTQTVQMKYSDYGLTVSVQRPPAAQTVEG
jgi:hypothetical protein